MKKLIAITTTAVLIVCFSTSASFAGSNRHHTLEGIMIGTGIAILGAAIYNEIQDNDRTVVVHHYGDRKWKHKKRHHYHHAHKRGHGHKYGHNRPHHGKYQHHGPAGRRVVQKTWVGPVYEKRWKPGHHNHRGKWVSGRHEKILVKEGYHKKEKKRVRH